MRPRPPTTRTGMGAAKPGSAITGNDASVSAVYGGVLDSYRNNQINGNSSGESPSTIPLK
jgi:hypothetical protein